MYLGFVLADELRKPRLEEGRSPEEILSEYQQGWHNLTRWFIGDHHDLSELTLLEKATKETIAKVVRSAVRLQERRRGGVSRRGDLDMLGQRFASLDNLDDAHKLAAYVFGLFPTRHLQGEDHRETERGDASTWEEPPNVRLIRTRSRKRTIRSSSEPMRTHTAKREAHREKVQAQLADERNFVEKMLGYGRVSIEELSPLRGAERLRLLHWIGRCTASVSRTFVTADGHQISVKLPADKKEAALHCDDGDLVMPNYMIEVLRGGTQIG